MLKTLQRPLRTGELRRGTQQPAHTGLLKREYKFFRFVVEVAERCDGALLNGPVRRYEFEQLPDFHVQCSGPDCRRGGVAVAPIIREMLGDHETERLLMEMCPGRVPLPDRKTVFVKCQSMFFIRLHFVRCGLESGSQD